MNYEKDIKIEETALDIEWLDQAALSLRYGKYFAECKRNLSNAQEKIKVIRSELVKEVNEDPEGCCNKSKPNAGDIEAYYRNHKDHRAIKEKIIELQYELDIAEVAKNEVSFTRKAALENLVRLHGQQYFAGPSVPRNLEEEVEKRQDRSNSKVGSRMKRTKRK